MMNCPHCSKEVPAVPDEKVAADYTANSAIRDRLKTAAENAARPHLEKIATLTTELQGAKSAAEKLPEVQAKLDQLLEADAFRVVGLGEHANVDVLKMMHTKATAALPEADRPDFLAWLKDSEKGAKTDPATAPLLAAWAATPAPATPAQPAAANGKPATPAASANGAAVPPKPVATPMPNVTTGTVATPATGKRPTSQQLQAMADEAGRKYAAMRTTDPAAAAAFMAQADTEWKQLAALPAE